MEGSKLRFRLVCDPSRRSILTELLSARLLGPDEDSSIVLREQGQVCEDAVSVVFDPLRLDQLQAFLDACSGPCPDSPRTIALKGKEGFGLIPLRSVLYFEADGALVQCFTPNLAGEVRERLYELEEKLPASRFVRVSKSAIVNLSAVREVCPWFSRSLLLRFGFEGRQVEVSRNYVRTLKDRLGL